MGEHEQKVKEEEHFDVLTKSGQKTGFTKPRSVRFGLEEAHGKGQALQFNWLFEKGAFVLNPDETFSVDFDEVEGAIESLSRTILAIQARGDKDAANEVLQKYCEMTKPLKVALEKLEMVQVPVDIAPEFPTADQILHRSPRK